MAETLRGSTGAALARMLGRSPSTVARELRRHAQGERYDAALAGTAYRQRRETCGRACKLVEGSGLYIGVRDRLLYRYWSPQQIAAIRRDMHPDDPGLRVSHETIYAAIYAQGMIAALRQAKPSRGRPRRTAAHRGGLNIDLSSLSQTQLNDIARLLNGRPRQTLGWRTPGQALAEEIQLFRNRVALDS